MAAQIMIHAVANRAIRLLSRRQLEEAQMIQQLAEAPTIQRLEEVLTIRQLVVVLITQQQEVTRTILHLQVKIQLAHAMTCKLLSLS